MTFLPNHVNIFILVAERRARTPLKSRFSKMLMILDPTLASSCCSEMFDFDPRRPLRRSRQNLATVSAAMLESDSATNSAWLQSVYCSSGAVISATVSAWLEHSVACRSVPSWSLHTAPGHSNCMPCSARISTRFGFLHINPARHLAGRQSFPSS